MTEYDRHFSDERIRLALDIIEGEGSRPRDVKWYDNSRVRSALLGMMAKPPQEPPSDLSPKTLPFTPESILASLASGRIADLELWETSVEAVRLRRVKTSVVLPRESLLPNPQTQLSGRPSP